MQWHHCSVLGIGERLLRHEDTVEELTLVLVSDIADLHHLGARLRQSVFVDSIEHKLILGIFVQKDSAVGSELDKVGLLTTEEVLDLNLGLILGNDGTDREMRIDHFHPVAETLVLLAIEGFDNYNLKHAEKNTRNIPAQSGLRRDNLENSRAMHSALRTASE